MLSLPSLWNGPETVLSRFWLDRESERKSGRYAAALTAILLLVVNVVLLSPRSTGMAIPLGDMPLSVEFRRLPPPELPIVAPEQPVPEVRKLLSETPEPERLVLSEPPLPPVVEKLQPAPPAAIAPQKPPAAKPIKKAAKPRPEQRQEAPSAPVTTESASNSPTGDEIPTRVGHASGQPDAKPDVNGAIMAALLHAVDANKHYPRQARLAGVEGKVILRVTIGANGRVTTCVLVEASGKTLLDAATEKLGAALVGLEIPSAHGKSMTVRIPVRYALKR